MRPAQLVPLLRSSRYPPIAMIPMLAMSLMSLQYPPRAMIPLLAMALRFLLQIQMTPPPEPIEGKPPDQVWLAEHKFDGVDFTLPSPDSSEGPFHLRRRLQGKITTWACHRPDLNRFAGSVNIWWGHTQGNEAWACNSWQAACKNSCTAKEVTQSHWNCYRQSDLKFVGQASISWGHGVGDGVYACNNWVSDCHTSQGGCLVTGAPHWNDGKPWDCHPLKSTWGDGCSVPDWLDVFPNAKEGLRLACDQHDYCYYGPIKNGFWDTYRQCTKLFFWRS